jgi:hypothetical protein
LSNKSRPGDKKKSGKDKKKSVVEELREGNGELFG